MGIGEHEYKALEDIVGPEYITRDPVIMETYNQVWANKVVFDEKWSTPPAAVLLPGSTEEVQAISRICILCEGNDEMWEHIQKVPPEMNKALEGTIVVVLGAASPGEMKYRENYLKIIMEKYSGMLIPDLNSPEVLGEVFESMVFGFGTVRYTTRLATDFFISPTSEGAQGFIKTVNKEARKLLEEYWKKETVIPGCQYLFNTPHEHYSAGAHVENLYLYDPFDPESLEATRELVGRTLDPHGKFRNFGAPCLGGGLQYEPVQHVSQNWGPVYENYDLWLRKIKTALDPNNVADWGAYVPTEYPEEKE